VHVSANGGTLPYSGTGDFAGVAAGSSSYTVSDANGCTTTRTISVANGTLTPPAKPGPISSSADATGLCGGGNFDYSIAAVTNATAYNWTPPTGGSINATTTDGTGITLAVPAGFTTGTLSVTASNVCGSSVAVSKTLSAVPAKPGAISGPSNVTPSQSGLVYSVPAVSGLTYKWTVPSGAKVTSGQNTATATVTWGTASGKISVKAINGCGASTLVSLSIAVSSKTLATTPSALAFDTICVNSLSTPKSFTLSGTGLNGSNVVVGPAPGFKVSLASAGTYADSLVITGYGTSINQAIYVKFNPSTEGRNDDSIVISGGGAPSAAINVSGVAIDSRPSLSALIDDITCSGANNGSIDLSLVGGIGPFSYRWKGTGTFDHTQEDISGLTASSYTITVTAYGGCKTSATYSITQPDRLVINMTADSMICKGGTTTVHVSATGGTLPYTGVGDFAGVSAGTSTYAISDANGCTTTKSIAVANGTGTTPAKPAGISGPADATGVCGGGDFGYAIAPVSSATSYTWTVPSGCSITQISSDETNITLQVPSGFTSGTLSVTASNTCGTSNAAADAVNSLPARPGPVTGPATVTANQTGTVYSVPATDGLTYKWTLPAGAVIVSGANTNAITVNWKTTGGNVTCKAVNGCGNSTASILSVTLTSALQSAPGSGGDALSVALPLITSIMPNPAKTVAYITFNATKEQKYSLEITSLSGKLLQHKDGIAYNGQNKVSLDVHNYANGVYIVTLINDKGERQTMKLVKE
jgi:hypothetical protein